PRRPSRTATWPATRRTSTTWPTSSASRSPPARGRRRPRRRRGPSTPAPTAGRPTAPPRRPPSASNAHPAQESGGRRGSATPVRDARRRGSCYYARSVNYPGKSRLGGDALMATTELDLGRYKLGWSDPEQYVFKPRKGLNQDIVNEMSWMKGEPDWMRRFRLRSLSLFERKPMLDWFAKNMPTIDFDDVYYYIKPTNKQVNDWDMLPDNVKNTYEKLGIPEAERKFLAGVTAQYESEVVYHKNRQELEDQGVLFADMDTAVREWPDLVKPYFGSIIPPNDNKFAALNSAVWSGGSFIYVPPNTHVEMPLQAYFRINA